MSDHSSVSLNCIYLQRILQVYQTACAYLEKKKKKKKKISDWVARKQKNDF